MLAVESRLPMIALVGASGLLLVALISWLLPSSLASTSLPLFGRAMFAEAVPVLHAHRVALLILALGGCITALIGLWGLPYPGIGLASALCVAAQIAALIVMAPLVVFVEQLSNVVDDAT